MTLIVAALLGAIQGVTEFLPISSSAHLILARAFFGWHSDAFGLPFDVALHVGTFVAVIAFFWKDVAAMVAALPAILTAPAGPGKLARLIVIGTIPIVIVGLLFAGWLETHLRTPSVIAFTLAFGAVLMLVAERLGSGRRAVDSLTAGDGQSLGAVDALLMGAAQASALVPGMSRSGTTIATGLFLGMTREAAARFSFLLGIPATAAAAGREGMHLVRTGLPPDQMTIFAVGMLTSAFVGYLTIKYFLRFLAGHRLDGFAYYRLALSVVTVAWLATR